MLIYRQLGHNIRLKTLSSRDNHSPFSKMSMSIKIIRLLILFSLITPTSAGHARLEDEAYIIQRMYFWGGAAAVFRLPVAFIAVVVGFLAWLRSRPVVARKQDVEERAGLKNFRRTRVISRLENVRRTRVTSRVVSPPPRVDVKRNQCHYL